MTARSFRDRDHISVDEEQLLSILLVASIDEQRNWQTRAGVGDQGMEDTMLLMFFMPLIVMSAMFEPRVVRKPIDRAED